MIGMRRRRKTVMLMTFGSLEKEIFRNAELFDDEEEEVDKEQAREKKKRHGEQVKKKKVVGQAKNKK